MARNGRKIVIVIRFDSEYISRFYCTLHWHFSTLKYFNLGNLFFNYSSLSEDHLSMYVTWVETLLKVQLCNSLKEYNNATC